MMYRCYFPKAPVFKDYGARGIEVCERWRKSFDDFYEDMGPRPAGMSIDRINVNGNYEPDNCRWADAYTQSSNRRFSKYVGITEYGDKWKVILTYRGEKVLNKICDTVDEAMLARQEAENRFLNKKVVHPY